MPILKETGHTAGVLPAAKQQQETFETATLGTDRQQGCKGLVRLKLVSAFSGTYRTGLEQLMNQQIHTWWGYA